MRVNNYHLVTNHALNVDFSSAPQQLNSVFGFSVQGVITGTPTGAVYLEASVDPNSGNVFPTNWSTISGSSQAVAAAGTFTFNVSAVEYNWVRLSYTDTSGATSTAVLNVVINSKGF